MITDGVRWWARNNPDRLAIVFDGTDEVDYATLDRWTDNAAHRLAALGVGNGDRVGFVGANSLEWIASAIGALKLGAVAVPFNNRFTPTEFRHQLTDAEPVAVVADEASRERMADAIGDDPIRLLPMESFAEQRTAPHTPVPPPTVDPDDVAIIVYTSGTTSKPKGVTLSHRSFVSFLTEFAVTEPVMRPGGRMIFVLSMSGMPGLPWHVLHPLTRGMTLFYERGFDAKAMLQRISEQRVEVVCGVPLLFEQMSALPEFAEADLSCIQLATVAGARVSPDNLKVWLDKGVVLRQSYGMTELHGLSSMNPVEEAIAHPEAVGRGSVFTPHRVVRADGAECAPGEEGEIVAKGPSITPGYWRNPEATEAAWRDGWFHTGDLGVADETGLIRMVDRMKDLIISGGYNIAPSEIENVIAGLPGVDEVCVVPVADERFGETPAAVVHGLDAPDGAAVVAHCTEHLAGYKVPRYVVHAADPLPRMASGKIARREIRELYADVPATHAKVR
ncbi:long-chain-fatty-acid--CoA ligase FadD13 [Pseudonocardia halophobica]|uniref:Long-chain-fatty-acid--CoA ligase FadD13 n=1 Tax=Pseudonocardia halophobica TaxID=29401 RepID=A0A9W6L665_9PSEU|nr:AMP-binding protein [Pseudonocardia halophobica]GLL13792.1 long-chain-fatty-acid--CoA ligase FadD13 [Pseudonocardia halophobica]